MEKEKSAPKSSVENREITSELKEAYLDYAMSVIVSRALPDVRDGLKPVQRRILWAMWESGVTSGAKLRKSANVVGEVMGKYHPHGDMAIYDTLVRLAQDFSLRYPLIEGQGNWGCFTKNTKVKLTDGRDLSFGELVDEFSQGKKNYTYTINNLGLISVAEIKNPRLTKNSAEIMKVVLDNGEEIKCTLNHLFMLRDGSYKEAHDLKIGESLMPLYQKLSTKTDRLDREGYLLLYQNKKAEWVPAHHLADNYNLTAGRYSKNAGRVRHHMDFNKLNNNPDNITRLQWGEHWRIHYQQAADHHKNPDYREKIAAGRKKIWDNPVNRERNAQRLSERNKRNWQDPAYKEKMSRFLSEVNKEYIKNHRVKKIEFLGGKEDVYDLTIDKSHNFALAAGIFVHNSIDGDGAAAMRYTETRLSKIAEELLIDIDKETVDWQSNYDGTKQEPKVLPAKLPNLLLNGAVGIAVGMATNIPPHNLGELVDAVTYLIDSPKATSHDLTNFIQGPDFPTGGMIYDKKAIAEAYATGKGAVTMRAKAEIKERGKGQYYIDVTEIPYQVNKSELLIKIAELITDKKIVGVRDVRDESDRKGLSIVIELKNDASPQKILNQLYQFTDLQKDFHLNIIALQNVKGGLQPQLMSLKDILAAYIEHRKEVVTKRAQFDLKKAEERAHILMGLAKALSVIDKIISTIKKSQDREDAHKNLVKNFKFTDVQATAILEMKLQTLANLERQKIEDELKEKKKLIAELQLLLKSPAKILKVIKDELAEIKKKYGDERRTKVIAGALGEFKEEDLVPKEEAVISMSQSGYIKRLPPTTFRSQGRGGKGLIGSEVGEEDIISHFIGANTHDNILFFTDHGRVFQTKVYEIPQGTRTAKGKPIHNFLQLPLEEKVTAIIAYPDSLKAGGNLIMVTKNGLVKKTTLEDFKNVRRNGIIAIKIKKGDLLKAVELSKTGDEVIITSANGQAIRFKESQARAMGRTAAGVRGIRLKKNDTVAEMDLIESSKVKDKNIKLLVVMANGYGKQTPLSQYRLQSRGGSGIKTAKITSKTGELIAAHVIDEEKELLALSNKGQIIKTELTTIRTASRATQGVKVMTLKPGDKLTGVICL